MSNYELTANDYKLCLMLLNKWKLETNVDEMFDIVNQKFTDVFKDFSKDDVIELYNSFNQGDISIFDENSCLKVLVPTNGLLREPVNSLLLILDDKQLKEDMKTNDCRSLVFPYFDSINNRCFIVFYDLFNDKKRWVSVILKFK